MFTIEQIKEAHSKVKSGADFPAYVQDLISLGVTSYETYVSDGHSNYFGSGNFSIGSESKYQDLAITPTSNTEEFSSHLRSHQQGKTDYPTFCRDCAQTGVHKWIVNLGDFTCTYFDVSGKVLLTEAIPQK